MSGCKKHSNKPIDWNPGIPDRCYFKGTKIKKDGKIYTVNEGETRCEYKKRIRECKNDNK